MHVAEERCQKLVYLNSHQECQLEQAQRDLEQCKRRLLEAQVQSRGNPLLQGEGTGAAAAAKGTKLRAVEKELKMASCSLTPNPILQLYVCMKEMSIYSTSCTYIQSMFVCNYLMEMMIVRLSAKGICGMENIYMYSMYV